MAILSLLLFALQDDRVAKLVADLGADDSDVRVTAFKELVKIGKPALKPLAAAAASPPREEVKLLAETAAASIVDEMIGVLVAGKPDDEDKLGHPTSYKRGGGPSDWFPRCSFVAAERGCHCCAPLHAGESLFAISHLDGERFMLRDWNGKFYRDDGNLRFEKPDVLARYLRPCKGEKEAAEIVRLLVGPLANEDNTKVVKDASGYAATVDIRKGAAVTAAFDADGKLTEIEFKVK